MIAFRPQTKSYIHGPFEEDGCSKKLPVGPVITSHSSLVAALWLEIFLKRPHEFKIEELRLIRSLFVPKIVERLANTEPFHAGFGNKPTDTKSYREVGENNAISRCFCRYHLHLIRVQEFNSTKFSS